ncbi:uncharacterized protein LOC116430070 [Nomia melanderi]|uniref:uncharacterized protein LOC116430070 n=1 Tax=Nomia melanderi TaxID=2448451 RepID=UPI0013040D6C|nr:uncharacterized protein LOC116430070 [Nomia melanderi]
MTEFEHLKDAVNKLKKSVSNFPVGAVSLDDYKPIEDRIKNMRNSLTGLNARLLMLKAHNKCQEIDEPPEGDIKDTVSTLHEATSNALLNNKAIQLCLYSRTIQNILAGKEGDPDQQLKIYTYLSKLFNLNDDMLKIEKEIEEAVQKQYELKTQCRSALFEYRKFLNEQEEIRNKKLQETNPGIVKNKQDVIESIQNINIMKQLIANLIAASNHLLMQKPELLELLEKHRDLISMEDILKMAQNNVENVKQTEEN